jgi:hypothetical protein
MSEGRQVTQNAGQLKTTPSVTRCTMRLHGFCALLEEYFFTRCRPCAPSCNVLLAEFYDTDSKHRNLWEEERGISEAQEGTQSVCASVPLHSWISYLPAV